MIALDLLTEAQRLTYQTASQFAQKELRAMADSHKGDESLVRHVLKPMADLGLLGSVFPHEYGGAEADYVSYALICEAIGGVSPSVFTGALTVQLSLVGTALNRFGSERQKLEVLKPMLEGDLLGAFALTEPNSGSDPAAGQTTATRDGDDWLLNGTKLWISNGSIADVILVFTQTAPGTRHKGMAAFLVRGDAPGLRRRPITEKLGLWESDTAELTFEDVRVTADALVGSVGDGFKISQASLESGRLTTAACAVGIGEACLQHSIAYAKARTQWGKQIGSHQLIQELVADMAINTQAARLLVHNAARTMDAGRSARMEVAMAKKFAAESAVKSARDAISLHGAVGYVEEMRVAGLLRDAVGLSLYEGTSQVQGLLVAREILELSAFA